jgi:hypothetical protein
MTIVRIDPGVCGHTARVEAVSDDGAEVRIKVESHCASVKELFEVLGDTFDGYEICLDKPGCGPLYAYAAEHFPPHCGCPVIAGVIKAAEAACKLALPKDVSITFER